MSLFANAATFVRKQGWQWLCITMLVLTGNTLADDSGKKVDWPGMRGATSTGVVKVDGILSTGKKVMLKEVWKQPLGSGYSSIAVAHNRAVTMNSDSTFDYVSAFDAKNGKPLWSFKIDSTYKGHDGSHDGPISTPFVDKKMVYALAPRGRMVALDAKSGKLKWETNVATDLGGEKPWYGFTSSPIVYKDLVILETGGKDANAVTAFNKKSGEVVWTAGTDTVTYQSPMLIDYKGSTVVLATADHRLSALNPESGEIVWEVRYGGDGSPIGSGATMPVPIGEDTYMLTHNRNASMAMAVKPTEAGVDTSVLWTNRNIRSTYNVPVYHGGHLYGFSNRFLTCVDAKTGKAKWKSRKPGDGFTTIVDGHLIVATKKGSVHISKASSEGFTEIASIKPFSDDAWSPASFSNGKLYVRSMKEIACLDIVEAKDDARMMADKTDMKGSGFAAFIASLDKIKDKNAAIDAYFAKQKSFPIVEKGMVHFVYRGEANDVAVTGDLFGGRNEVPMTRVDGTDLFYRSSELESNARLEYSFMLNYETPIGDTLNTERSFSTPRGPVSWFGMPDWKKPSHLSALASADTGRVDTMRFEATVPDTAEGWTTNRRIDVYLPKGYDKSDKRYPVVYVHDGQAALQQGMLKHSLDNLIANKQIQPVIAVFVYQGAERPNQEYGPGLMDKYATFMAEHLVPHIDKTYRTLASSDARLNHGAGFSSSGALYTTFKNPQVFGNLSLQSAFVMSYIQDVMLPVVQPKAEHNVKMYVDWGKYDLRGAQEKWDTKLFTSQILSHLKDKGYKNIATSEHPTGFGWGSWRGRNDMVLKHFFAR